MPLKDDSKTSTRTIRENASIVGTLFDLFFCCMQEIHHKSISVCKHIGGQGCQCANKSVDNYMFVCKQVFKVSQLLLLLLL